MDSDFLWHCSCSTIGAIIMTPLLTKLLAGQLVPVDAAVSFFFYLLILCKKKKKPSISNYEIYFYRIARLSQ